MWAVVTHIRHPNGGTMIAHGPFATRADAEARAEAERTGQLARWISDAHATTAAINAIERGDPRPDREPLVDARIYRLVEER